MDRKVIREQTMQLIFQMEITGDFDYEHLSFVEENEAIRKQDQSLRVLEAIRDHIGEIDAHIDEYATKWKTTRMAKTDLAILRLAVCEIDYIDSVPNSVSIDEAVRIAKKYGDERSYAFINSVLGKIVAGKNNA